MSRFDDLNRATRDYNQRGVCREPWYGSQGCGLSTRDRIAHANNETYCANNGDYRDRPYGSSGYTYSTGK